MGRKQIQTSVDRSDAVWSSFDFVDGETSEIHALVSGAAHRPPGSHSPGTSVAGAGVGLAILIVLVATAVVTRRGAA